MNRTSTLKRWRSALAVALAAVAVHGSSAAADIDIYASSGSGAVPNVLFFLDNTANWSSQAQGWVPKTSWDSCQAKAAAIKAGDPAKGIDPDPAGADEYISACQDAIKSVFYVGDAANQKYPWDKNYNSGYWTKNKVPQGSIELRALRYVLKALVCDAAKPLNVNVGVSLFTPVKGSALSSGDAVAIIHHAVQRLTKSGTNTCQILLDKLDTIDVKINDPAYKAPADANYGVAFYEVFKYFGGYTNPTLAAGAVSTPGNPVSATGYGPTRFSRANNPLDDPAAFVQGSSGTTYLSPISGGESCGNNYMVLIGNTYPNNEPQSGPPKFGGLNYAPPQLSLVTSDTTKFGDEWSYFLSNTDINDATGIQRLFTYAVNVYNDKPDPSQTKLLKSIATVGGVGGSAYIEVGGDLYALVEAFKGMLLEISAVDSVFTATTLPVSTTTQGTYLNQVFVGMFRPDAQFNPRWIGNLKQFQLGFDANNVLQLVDSKNNSAVLGSTGFFSPLSVSFWTKPSVFFNNLLSGTPPSASDLPDGAIVEKGGVAQQLRINNIYNTPQGSGSRNVYTLPGSLPLPGTSLSTYGFTAANMSSTFSSAEVAWIRGEANVTSGSGAEEFIGSWDDNKPGTITNLGTTGARHSIHGDVLHSRPVAINYGGDNVIVYYGSNDGFLRAIDGRKTVSTGGSELWSFVAPEHYDMLRRLRNGKALLHLPETNSAGQLVDPVLDAEPKDYAFDGPIGSYVLYKSGATAVKEAMIYAAMRRGGKAVYAIDVTDPKDPKFQWKVESGGSFSDLAQTWSMAKPIVYKSTTGDPPVVVMMGGGYDVAEEKNSTGSPAGNRVYFINGRTGQLLGSVKTDYSVAADVTVVDLQNDGIPDRAYAVDVRGNLYRIDLPSSSVLDPSSWDSTKVKAVKLAALGGKAFYAVDAVVTKDFVAVLVGTGDREKPLLTSKICCDGSAAEGFYMVKDSKPGELPPQGVPFKPENLALIAKVDKATMNVIPVEPDANLTKNGCYMTLAENGEKVVNAPTTIGGVAYFGTNRPTPGDSLSCRASLGEAYAYRFPLFCKTPTNNKLATGGMPPSPVAGVVTIDGKKVPFIIGGGTSGSPFTPEQPNPVVSPVRQRQFWYIDNANR